MQGVDGEIALPELLHCIAEPLGITIFVAADVRMHRFRVPTTISPPELNNTREFPASRSPLLRQFPRFSHILSHSSPLFGIITHR
jgi:hypothetical protein